MITFTKMTLSGFGPFKDDQEVQWDNPSTLVLGHSFDAAASESNGTGKSSLFKALTWVLYGETPDGSSGDDVVNQRSKVATVTLSFTDDKQHGRISRTRKQHTTESHYCSFDGKNGKVLEEVTGVKQVTEAVERLLGMDWSTFKNTIMYCQGDYKRFADPTTTDSERKSILRKILGLEVIADCAALARKRITGIKQERTGLEAQRGEVERILNTSKSDLVDSMASLQSWDKEQKAEKDELKKRTEGLCEKVVKIGAFEGEMKRAEVMHGKTQKQIDGLGVEIDALEVKKSQWRDKIVQQGQKRVGLQSEERELLRKLEQLKGNRCPVCDSKLSGLAPVHYKSDLEKQLEGVKASLEKISKIAVELDAHVDQCGEVIKDIEHSQDELHTIRCKLDIIVAEKGADIKHKLAIEEQIKVNEELINKAANNPYVKMVEDLKQRLETEAGRIVDIASKLDDMDTKVEQLEFWTKAYGTGGFINWCLSVVLPQLETSANQYLSVLTDGTISLSLDTQSQLKSGSAVDKLGINLDIENNGSVKPSGGQSKRISLALSLALMFLVRSRTGANISNLFLDEPDGGLDGGGKDRFYGPLLDQLKQQHGNIAVITHDPNVRGLFDDVIMVKRQKGESSVIQKT